MEKLKEFAKKLNGVEYGYPLFSKEIIQEAKENGYVIVSGASDDLMKLDGAIQDEFGCWDGGTAIINENGIIEKGSGKWIRAYWCEEEIPWTYETDIPHVTFEILEEGSIYCLGIVFNIKDLSTQNTQLFEFEAINPDSKEIEHYLVAAENKAQAKIIFSKEYPSFNVKTVECFNGNIAKIEK